MGLGLGASYYESEGIQLIENTPEEIRDVCVEMEERLNDTWEPETDDDALQRQFWEIFPVHAVNSINGRPLHGDIRGRFGMQFLRNNREFLG